MSKMIHTAGNFQYSVNIAYDLQNPEKLRGFIPTKSSLDLLEDILLSAQSQSSKRARILIGAYGKGKSHIVLTILSILKHHEPMSDFVHLVEKLSENPKLNQLVQNYYESGKKLLPVLVTGNGTSLGQSFLLSLKNTLSENGLSDFLPDTNYKAAVNAIKKWQADYPATLKRFEELAGQSAADFVSKLEDFNLESYKKFESLYPSLTAGSVFNPFLGFDVPLLYESVAKELRRQNLYDGLYVVYDEFSKYLESNIESASVSDTKMLQDFAEKACRSAENQLHLLLISHKEIANYIDRLPKQKTDGWRGISERFEHVLLNNNFSQVYEIISTVIQKEPIPWRNFLRDHNEEFSELEENYKKHELFNELGASSVGTLIKRTFPLHPVSAFVLPRLSERIAQNERTLFTFLSADTEATLPSFLKTFDDSAFSLVTPDLIFDYFEPLLKKEVYSGELHEIYHLTGVILEKLNAADGKTFELERKIVKTISLIYILSQFERLKPVAEEIVRIYSYSYPKEEIEKALKNLIENEFVIYLRQSNSYLKLKETSGVDIAKTIHDEIERGKKAFDLCSVLNANNGERYFYPYRYNDQKEMTRFFEFDFVDCGKINDAPIEGGAGDGKIIAVVCKNQEEADACAGKILEFSRGKRLSVFCVLKAHVDMEKSAASLDAISELVKKAGNDEILSSEYRVVMEDVSEIVAGYIKKYTRPENGFCSYFHDGKKIKLNRRSELTEKLSDICESVFDKSPIVNNEAINKNEITQMAFNSRRKILAGLLRNPLEKNLGLAGCGQDVAIMRSCLLHTGLLKQDDSASDFAELDFSTGDDKYQLRPMLESIENFVRDASVGRKSFSELYEKLTSPKFGIGARRGIIPIYVAAVFGRIKNQLVFYHGDRQVPVNADSLALLNERPDDFSLLNFNLDEKNRNYLSELKNIFSSKTDTAEEIAFSIQNWYLSLPKYSREAKTEYSNFLKTLKNGSGAQELLFTKFPAVFGKSSCDRECAGQIEKAKSFYDKLIFELKNKLSGWIFEKFGTSDLKNWLKTLPEEAMDHLFADGTERFLSAIKNSNEYSGDFMEELAVAATGLRLSDWGESTKELFFERISAWKDTAQAFAHEKTVSGQDETFANVPGGKTYSISFPDSSGKIVTRNFDKVAESVRAKLLFNKLTDALETMGKSMSEAEKRQVLMNVLQKMCGGND